MALLFMDGFDHMGNGVKPTDVGKWGQLIGSIGEIATNNSRTGGCSLTLYYVNDEIVTKPMPASGGFVVGMAIRFNGTPSASDFLRIREGASIVHMSLALTATGFIVVKNGAGTVLATGTQALPSNAWSYVEFKGIIDDVAGSYEVRIDGVEQPGLINPGPIDTRNGGTGQWDRIALLSLLAGWNYYVDDFYVCDMSGADPYKDFLGAVRIETLMAQPGNGSNVEFTPSTGTDHGALVDEKPGNITDYNSAGTVGMKDTYNLPSLASTGAILGIQTCLYANKSDSGVRKTAAVVRVGAADYDGADKTLTTTFGYQMNVWTLNPATGLPWVKSDIDALEVGMKVTV